MDHRSTLFYLEEDMLDSHRPGLGVFLAYWVFRWEGRPKFLCTDNLEVSLAWVGLSTNTDQAGAGEKYPNRKVCYRLLPPDQDWEG